MKRSKARGAPTLGNTRASLVQIFFLYLSPLDTNSFQTTSHLQILFLHHLDLQTPHSKLQQNLHLPSIDLHIRKLFLKTTSPIPASPNHQALISAVVPNFRSCFRSIAMSLITIPDELVLEIGSYLLPQSLDLLDEPFSNWTISLSDQAHDLRYQAKEFYDLSQTCRKLHNILPRHPSHAHLKDPNMELLQSVLQLLGFETLSVHNLSTRQDNLCSPSTSENPDNDGSCSNQNLEDKFNGNVRPFNTAIHSIYLVCDEAPKEIFGWLLGQLPGLKTLHFEFKDAMGSVLSREILFGGIIEGISDQKLESLVLTLRKSNYNWDWGSGLSKTLSLNSLENLTTLKISSFLLLGSERQFSDYKEVYKQLPISLHQLEVFYDRPFQYPFIIPPISDRWVPSAPGRPVWLFQLLEMKKVHTPKLERVRIISDENWEGLGESRVWSEEFVPHPNDWVVSDGKKAWKPPMELIQGFEKAKVCFGLYIQPQVCFRLMIPGVQWFSDSWEGKWDQRDESADGISEFDYDDFDEYPNQEYVSDNDM